MARTYQQVGLVLGRGHADKAMVKALQRDLRALGYLRRGIDGDFGAGTEAAVRSLQFDLLNNDGIGPDGRAPVAVRDFNKGRVAASSGTVDAALAACIDELMTADAVQKVPRAADAAGANKRALAQVLEAMSKEAPTPFLVAMVQQESGGKHFAEPSARDEDDFVTVGLDRNKGPDQITSRGYGIGQHTLFHHPPSKDEVDKHIADPVGNVAKAYAELRHKFDRFLLGADAADDRKAEHAQAVLRLCKHDAASVLYMRDCAACAKAASKVRIASGDPVHAGAALQYAPSTYYASADYDGVPARADFACDWPYAIRRYNGGGINSYHYQARVLLNLLRQS